MPRAPAVGSNGAIYAATDPPRSLFLVVLIVTSRESFNRVRTYVRFLCEWDHRRPLQFLAAASWTLNLNQELWHTVF